MEKDIVSCNSFECAQTANFVYANFVGLFILPFYIAMNKNLQAKMVQKLENICSSSLCQ